MIMSKYNNVKTKHDVYSFASKKEAARYLELKELEAQGMITDLELQKAFVLIPARKGKIRSERSCTYIADFAYKDVRTGEAVVEDVKGCRKGQAYQLYVIKRKLMAEKHGIEIREV